MKPPGRKAYPKEIDINGDMWEIKFVRRIKYPKKKGEIILGLCDPSTSTIYIKQGLPKYTTLETFLHEIGHAIENSYEVTLSHKAIDSMAVAMAQIICDNF